MTEMGPLRHQPRLHTIVLALALVAVFLSMWASSPDRFLRAANLQSMAFQLPELGLLALAMMVTMVGGGIDLSIVATSNLAGIVTAISLSKRTMRTIKQNLFWAFAYNSALIPIAAGALYFTFGQTGVPGGLHFILGD